MPLKILHNNHLQEMCEGQRLYIFVQVSSGADILCKNEQALPLGEGRKYARRERLNPRYRIFATA
jgi:hypothetical protein